MIKIFVFNCFDFAVCIANTDKLKKLNLGVKLFEPKSGPAKGKSKFEILIVKIFCLKQKANQIFTAAIEKVKFILFKETIYGSSRQVITMKKRKTKAIQADLTIFPYIPAYSDIFTFIQAQSSIFRNYSSIFRHIQNPV